MARDTTRDDVRAMTATAVRARVRMYRHGLGDCMLVRLPRRQGRDFSILIDCGVILGTKDASALMARVLTDVADATGGHIDLLVGTHEHWDHLSGFIQAEEAFAALQVDQVWLSWAEDPADELAEKLRGERELALTGLAQAATAIHLAGDSECAGTIESLLEFFGAARGRTTRDALEAVRGKSDNLSYVKPLDSPVTPDGCDARIYVLGPPRDERQIKKARPSGKNPETYTLAFDAFAANVTPALGPQPLHVPFGRKYVIPTAVAQELPFFRRYWETETWRIIDTDWLSADATELALQLDSATNNTSLVLAIELGATEPGEVGDVLLFAADAQVGNWLSWKDVSWPVAGRVVTGPDLLAHTILYKVGHHGSHNATLKEQGLEAMDRLQLAMIPVIKEMAEQKKWGHMPLPSLVEALTERTSIGVLQSDRETPEPTRGMVTQTDLYFEVTL